MDLLFTSLLGSTHNAKIIVTSRILPLLKNGDNLIDALDEKRELKGLKLNFAVDFLVKNGLEEVERKKLEELATDVDGHPLALRLLIELVKKFGVSDTLNDLSMFQKHKKDTILKARRLFEKLAGDEKELLESISVFRKPESMAAIKTMFTDRTSKDAVEKLMDKSLLETYHKGNYWLHPLIREFSYDDLKNKKEIHQLACSYYLTIVPEKRTKKDDVQSLIEAQYHACMAKEYDQAASIIFDKNLDEDLDRWGEYRTLVELYSGVLPKDHFSDKILLSDINIHSRVLGNLGNAYRHLGEVRKAFGYYVKALKIAQDTRDRRNEGIWLGNVGNAYSNLGSGYSIKAIEYYEKALKIAQEIGDRKNEDTWLGNLGNVYRNRGYGYSIKAIEYYEKALKIAQEIGDRRGEGFWLGNVGSVYIALGQVEKAIQYHEKALAIDKEIGDRRGEGADLGNLGLAYLALGQVEKAIQYYEKALAIAQEIGDRINESTWFNNLGDVFQNEKKYKEALACYLSAKGIRTRINDPKLKTTESKLKNLEEKLGEKEFEKLAAEVAPRAEEIVRKMLEERSD
jgi:tetratricopeptide (TPR) repeat protein